MPRGPRLDAPGVLHHVMARGIERRRIFLDNGDYQGFISRFGRILLDSGAVCYAWALLSNHFHLLIRTGQGNLVKIMRRLMTGYAINFNLRHNRAGHLFQNRYKSVICQEEPYLLELVRYIHLNPLRVGVVNSLKELEEYPWSGYRILMGKGSNGWQAIDEVLGRFGDMVGEARKQFQRFMSEGKGQDKRPELMGGGLVRSLGGWEKVRAHHRWGDRVLSDTRILGNSDFVSQVLEKAEVDKRDESFDLPDLINWVSSVMGIEVDQIKGSGKIKSLTDARAVIAFLAIERLGIRGSEVARELHQSRSSVSRSVLRGKKVIFEYPDLEEVFR
jgi:putative transposase